MTAIPAEYLDLLQQKTAFAHLATIMPDGTPQVTPVWFDYKDGKIRINSAKGRGKARPWRFQYSTPTIPTGTSKSVAGLSTWLKRAHRRTSIPSPRNTSGKTN